MKFDFDTKVSRENTYSVKWDTEKMQGGKEILPMWIADMDFETVPQIKEAIANRAKHGIYGYTQRGKGYYEAIIDWNRKRHNWQLEGEWITHSLGVVNALFTAIRAFTSVGDGVLVQPPVYHPFYRAIKYTDRQLYLNPLKLTEKGYEIDFVDFEDKLRSGRVKLFMLCNPHNPVGRVFTKEELTLMGDLCLKYKVLVVSDEIHSDLIYRPHSHTPLAAISKGFQENSITCTAPSKTFNLAGLATSNIIIPNPELRQRYNWANDVADINPYNIFGAIACEAAYRHGEEWLEALLQYLSENKDYAVDFIEKNIPEISVVRPEGTYFLWLDFSRLGLSKEALERFLLDQAGLWLNQGHIFGSEGEGFARMNFACPKSILEEALHRLKAAIAEFLIHSFK